MLPDEVSGGVKCCKIRFPGLPDCAGGSSRRSSITSDCIEGPIHTCKKKMRREKKGQKRKEGTELRAEREKRECKGRGEGRKGG